MVKMFRSGILAAVVAMSATVAPAQEGDALDQLIDALEFDESIAIMHDEGLRYGGDVALQMMPQADMDSWSETVARIYDTDKMLALITQDFRAELDGADVAPMLDYFTSDAGQRVIRLELEARRAFLDPDIEAAATARFAEMQAEDAVLVSQVDQLIEESDLVEFNVMGTLNASLMFYRGLSDGGAYDMTEEDMLRDVWSQEEETRVASREWLGAFLALAYQPLDSDILDGYAAFYRTPEGRELNRAIFASFDKMYIELSYLMGRAVAEHLTSEPL